MIRAQISHGMSRHHVAINLGGGIDSKGDKET